MSEEMRKRILKRIRRTRPPNDLPVSVQSPLAQTPRNLVDSRWHSRHATWASAIAERFALRIDRRGALRPSLVDLAIPAKLRILFRHLGGALHHHFYPTVHNVLGHTSVRQILPGHLGSGLISGREMREGASSESRLLIANRSAARGAGNLPLVLSSSSRSQAAQLESTKATEGSAFCATVLRRIAAPVRRRMQEQMEYQDEWPGENVMTRITRQHRRNERTRAEMAREFVAGSPIRVPDRLAFALEQTYIRPSTNRKLNEPQNDKVSANAVVSPAINVTQVADEVMKHLDRRLIAARERMGRI